MKKNLFVVLNKKNILVPILLIFSVCFVFFMPSVIGTTSPQKKYTVVIDAGHGGIDGGCEGATTGVTEASLNLDYAKCLKEKLESFGFNVVMTRTSESGLYNPLASNKKRSDMEKRKKIVENSNADFVISIHMNSYNSSASGAQVFYGEDDEPSKFLADSIQKHFVNNLEFSRSTTKTGDYYILNAIKSPSVLVECGYLSNPKEEACLITEEYKNEVCYSILLGVLEYLQ